MQPPAGKRSAGILLHIPSLPSSFGIGDLGPEALKFAEFLHRSNQRFWQVLPLTPVEQSQSFSPYSSVSGMAGNTLLISPEALMHDGLLKRSDILPFHLPASDKVKYKEAMRVKNQLLAKAYHNFRLKKQDHFESFCHREAYWLDDFARYRILREHFKSKPWYEWPEEFKSRKQKSLLKFEAAHSDAIKMIKWLQFIFFEQWRNLKSHCNKRNIRILGDLPFYVSHDSVDVWTHPALFHLKKNGAMAGIGGVPPDYFNKDGQLWGMPVYRWNILKEQRFAWWIERIRKNLERVDMLRLDHFRAFSEYWEVPAGNSTAKKGKWRPGPGAELFKALKKKIGGLPLVAEDLGDISEAVYQLRDRFHLPGMKVLQFAFGKSMPESDHIPHNFTRNFIAYTGTHDNNTTLGWYTQELKKQERQQLEHYAGQAVTKKNVHTVLARLAYASVADTVILPLQDVLGLNERARTNTPASTSGNWLWRLMPGQPGRQEEDFLKTLTKLYGR